VDATEALDWIRGYAAADRIIVRQHARERMRQRGVQYADVRSALTSATACTPSAAKWKVTGPDQDGDALTCVVALEDGVVVVTVF
jgi:hypothetical protein